MILCQCNAITEHDIVRTVRELLDEDAWQLVRPVQVYHRLGRRGRCCSCFPNAIELIVMTVEAYHAEKSSPPSDVVSFVSQLRERQRLGSDRLGRRGDGDHACRCGRPADTDASPVLVDPKRSALSLALPGQQRPTS